MKKVFIIGLIIGIANPAFAGNGQVGSVGSSEIFLGTEVAANNVNSFCLQKGTEFFSSGERALPQKGLPGYSIVPCETKHEDDSFSFASYEGESAGQKCEVILATHQISKAQSLIFKAVGNKKSQLYNKGFIFETLAKETSSAVAASEFQEIMIPSLKEKFLMIDDCGTSPCHTTEFQADRKETPRSLSFSIKSGTVTGNDSANGHASWSDINANLDLDQAKLEVSIKIEATSAEIYQDWTKTKSQADFKCESLKLTRKWTDKAHIQTRNILRSDLELTFYKR